MKCTYNVYMPMPLLKPLPSRIGGMQLATSASLSSLGHKYDYFQEVNVTLILA